jgi:hypothetical protein
MADQKSPATLAELVAQRQTQLRDGMPNFEQLQTERKQYQNDLAALEPVVARLTKERSDAQLIANDLQSFFDQARRQTGADLDDTIEKQLETQLKDIDAAIKKAGDQVVAQQQALDAKATTMAQKEAMLRACTEERDKARTALKSLPESLKAAAAAAKRHQALISAALVAGQMRKAYVLILLMAPDLQKVQELAKLEAEQALLKSYQDTATALVTAQNELRAAQAARDTEAQALQTAQAEQKKLISAREANIQALYNPQPLPNQ